MKIFSRRVTHLLLLLAVLFLAFILSWKSLSYALLKNVAQFYAGRADIELTLGAIGGEPFSEITIANLSIQPQGNQQQAYLFKAGAIKCSYDLWALKAGIEPFVQGLKCSVNDPVVSSDLRAARSAERSTEAGPLLFVPAWLPELEINNGAALLTDSDWTVEAAGINAVFQPGAAGEELLLEVGTFRFRQENVTRIETGFTTKLQHSGAQIILAFLDLGAKEIRATGMVDFAPGPKGQTSFSAELSFAESLVGLAGAFGPQGLEMQVQTEGFDTGELQKRLGGLGWPVAGDIVGEVKLTAETMAGAELAGYFTVALHEGRLNGVDIQVLNLAGDFRDGRIGVAKAELETRNNRLVLSNISLSMDQISGGDPLAIIAGGQGEFAADIADAALLREILQPGRAGIEAGLWPDYLSLRGKLAKGVISLAEARVVMAGSSLVISAAEVPIPATMEGLQTVPVILAARLESSDLAELLNRFADIPLQGQASVELSLKGSLLEPDLAIKFAGAQLVFEEVSLGAVVAGGDLQLVLAKPGRLQGARFKITELRQTNDSGTVVFHSPLEGSWQPEKFLLNGAFRIDGKSDGALRIEKERQPGFRVAISASDLDSDGWLGDFVDSRYFFNGADIEAVVTGLPGRPRLQIGGSVARAGAAGVPFPLTGKFALHYSASGIEISEFSWESLDRNHLTLTGKLPYDPLAPQPYLAGDLLLKGHLDFSTVEDLAVFLAPLGIEQGSLSLDVDLGGSWAQPLGQILLRGEGLAPPGKLKEHLDSPMDLHCEIVVEAGAIILKAATLESTLYAAQVSGSLRHQIPLRELLGEPGKSLGGEVAVDATVQLKDLSFLRQKMPWLRRLEGDLQGKIHLAGPLAAPAINGSFSLQDGELSHIFNFPALYAVNVQGEFDEQSINIKKMQAEVGGSPVNLSGHVSRDHESFAVNLQGDGKNVLLFRNNDMQMRGDVQLAVSGPVERLVIEGVTGLTGGYYTGNIDLLGKIGSTAPPVSEGGDFLFSFQEPPLKNALLDIKITTIEPFRIRNNLIRGVLRPELSLQGTGELPFLVGAIYIDPSRLLLPSGRLKIQSGLVRFLAGEPDTPQIDILAQSKIMGYDINVVTRGPLADPVITLSSSPALPNDDLLLLLLTGQIPKQDATQGTTATGTRNVMVYLGRDFLNKWLEDETSVSDETILDRLELDMGRGVTRSGDQTVESTFRLSKENGRTGKVYYLSSEKDKYDAYNYGLKVVFTLE